MYTDVAFKYDTGIRITYIYEIFISIDLGCCGDVHYIIMGLSRDHGCYPKPIVIGALGSFTDVNSALRRVEEVAKKYPPLKSIPDEIINCLDCDIESYIREQYPLLSNFTVRR